MSDGTNETQVFEWDKEEQKRLGLPDEAYRAAKTPMSPKAVEKFAGKLASWWNDAYRIREGMTPEAYLALIAEASATD
jgi:hypothetical protein